MHIKWQNYKEINKLVKIQDLKNGDLAYLFYTKLNKFNEINSFKLPIIQLIKIKKDETSCVGYRIQAHIIGMDFDKPENKHTYKLEDYNKVTYDIDYAKEIAKSYLKSLKTKLKNDINTINIKLENLNKTWEEKH